MHALALALFLPRATVESSPFRFVILDDPIQAMDPAKIDGFARLLAGIAQDRQVVVFSHDDRLPDAVRRMAIPGARILEIARGLGSNVEVRACPPCVTCSTPAVSPEGWTSSQRRSGGPRPAVPGSDSHSLLVPTATSGASVDHASMRSKIIVTRMLRGDETGDRAALAWAGLSRACHHHAYELAPAEDEVNRWLGLVSVLVHTGRVLV